MLGNVSVFDFQTGTIRGTRLAVEHMRKDKGGRGGVVINVASSGGIFFFSHIMQIYQRVLFYYYYFKFHILQIYTLFGAVISHG